MGSWFLETKSRPFKRFIRRLNGFSLWLKMSDLGFNIYLQLEKGVDENE
jgi:hypothetical protein